MIIYGFIALSALDLINLQVNTWFKATLAVYI